MPAYVVLVSYTNCQSYLVASIVQIYLYIETYVSLYYLITNYYINNIIMHYFMCNLLSLLVYKSNNINY